MTTRRGASLSWLAEIDDAALRETQAEGYRPGAQLRSVATTRRLLEALWLEMGETVDSPVQLHSVLQRSGVSSSSFYERFDGLRPLVALTGLLLLQLDRGRRESGVAVEPPIARSPSDAAAEVASDLVAAILPPGGVPREVLSLGVWCDEYVSQRAAERARWTGQLAGRIDAAPRPSGGGSSTYRRALTFSNLIVAFWEQVWMVGGLVVPNGAFEQRRRRTDLIARLLFDPTPADWSAAAAVPDDLGLPVRRSALRGRSSRHAATLGDFREATRLRLVADGLDLQVSDIAAHVHRSPASFFDTFGSVGGALADLAAAEQVARIPVELFRPRAEVAPEALVEHLSWRLRAWQDSSGVTGRRLLQAAGRFPEVAEVIAEQALASAELLVGWYSPVFRLPPPILRMVFLAILSLHQHQVLWGELPPVVAGPDAMSALLAPVVVPSP